MIPQAKKKGALASEGTPWVVVVLTAYFINTIFRTSRNSLPVTSPVASSRYI